MRCISYLILAPTPATGFIYGTPLPCPLWLPATLLSLFPSNFFPVATWEGRGRRSPQLTSTTAEACPHPARVYVHQPLCAHRFYFTAPPPFPPIHNRPGGPVLFILILLLLIFAGRGYVQVLRLRPKAPPPSYAKTSADILYTGILQCIGYMWSVQVPKAETFLYSRYVYITESIPCCIISFYEVE